MSEALVRAAERLEAVLLAENAALAALDFNGAMALLAEKEAAAQGFSAAQGAAHAAGGAVASLRARALELGHSLALLGEEVNGGFALLGGFVGAVLLTVGVFLLSRSPLLAAQEGGPRDTSGSAGSTRRRPL